MRARVQEISSHIYDCLVKQTEKQLAYTCNIPKRVGFATVMEEF